MPLNYSVFFSKCPYKYKSIPYKYKTWFLCVLIDILLLHLFSRPLTHIFPLSIQWIRVYHLLKNFWSGINYSQWGLIGDWLLAGSLKNLGNTVNQVEAHGSWIEFSPCSGKKQLVWIFKCPKSFMWENRTQSGFLCAEGNVSIVTETVCVDI